MSQQLAINSSPTFPKYPVSSKTPCAANANFFFSSSSSYRVEIDTQLVEAKDEYTDHTGTTSQGGFNLIRHTPFVSIRINRRKCCCAENGNTSATPFHRTADFSQNAAIFLSKERRVSQKRERSAQCVCVIRLGGVKEGGAFSCTI